MITNSPGYQAIVEIQDDKIKITKHGLDEWSFRRHKDDAK